jgi:PEP-CTERM/exosortase A-associated glycosyltransferase
VTATINSGLAGGCVLHVLDHSWPVLSGYSIRSRGLITAQHNSGQEVLAVTGPLHELDDQSSSDITVDGVSYVRTPITGSLTRPALERRWPLIREAATVRVLRDRILELIDQRSISIVYAHSPALCGLAGLQAARKKGLPFVYEIRAFWEDAAVDQKRATTKSLRYWLTRRLELWVAKRADAVSAIAQPILKDLRERNVSPEKLFHVSNGVDVDRFTPSIRDEELARSLAVSDSVVFGFFGSLYRYEGIAWMIPAIAKLRARGNRFKVLIIGGGEDEEGIRNAIRHHGAGEYVHMVGRVPHDEIKRYYSLVDIMVFPRLSVRLTELVTPLKPLEAMALRKAVLASDVGGHRELLRHEKNGLLFRAGDIGDFCAQGERLLSSADLRRQLGDAGREAVVRDYDWKVLAQRYQKIYEFVSQRRRNRGRIISQPVSNACSRERGRKLG